MMENYWEGKGQSLDGEIFSPGWACIKQEYWNAQHVSFKSIIP